MRVLLALAIEGKSFVKESNVTFSKLSALFVDKNSLEITSNSSIIFKELNFNLAIYFLKSHIHIKHNAKLILFNNTADNSIAIFGIDDCNVTISENEALIVEHNLVSYDSSFLVGSSIIWNIHNQASIIFQDNVVQNSGYIVWVYALVVFKMPS